MLKVILVIIGTIIGAGFASGKEIFTFFNVHGFYGIIGLLFSTILIGLIIYKTFRIIIRYNITCYPEFINTIISKSNFINTVICNVINIFLLISFIVMVAGFSAYFSQEFNISYIFGALLICILSFFTFLHNINGIIKINKFFIPFLIFIILLLGLKNSVFFTPIEYHTLPSNFNWFISSLLYASYNLIVIFPILISVKKYVPTLKEAKIISLFVTSILAVIATTLFLLINYYFTEIYHTELPIIYIASKMGIFYKYTLGFVILGAIFTTAISSGYSFLNNLNLHNKKLYILTIISMCLLAIALSNIGFSSLLNLLYPILGLLRFSTNYFYIIF